MEDLDAGRPGRERRGAGTSRADLRERAEAQLGQLRSAGQDRAQLYLADPDDGIHGAGAFFLLLDELEVYALPPDPMDPRQHLGGVWGAAGAAALALGAGLVAAALRP